MEGVFSFFLRKRETGMLWYRTAWSCKSVLEEASNVVAIGTTPALITAHVLSEVPADIFASAFAASD